MYDWIFNHVVDFLVLVLVSYPIVGGIAFIISSIYQRVFNERRQLPHTLKVNRHLSVFLFLHIMRKTQLRQPLCIWRRN